MKPIVALPFHSQARLFCDEARQMLLDAGFELRCNTSGIRPTAEDLKKMLDGAFAVIAGTEKYTADVLADANDLKAVIRFGVGTDNFDLKAMGEKGLQVGVIANHNAVAEFALTLMLSLLKNLPRLDRAARAGQWARFPMRELSAKTVGLVGFGRIGRRLAELLSGFGVTLLVYDPFVPPEAIRACNAEPVSLEQLLNRSDLVSLHLPATPQTHHLIDGQRLAQMKDGAYLINTARGALVDEAALLEALQSGKLAGAALDVFEQEPLSGENPLLALDNTVFAPHVSALSFETNYNGSIICAESIIRVYRGEPPVYPVRTGK